MQPIGHTRKDRAAFRLRLAAHGDYILKHLGRFPDIEHSPRLLLWRNIHADFPHYLDDQRIDRSRFQACTLRLKMFTADMVKPRLRHLAARAIVHANEQDILFESHAES